MFPSAAKLAGLSAFASTVNARHGLADATISPDQLAARRARYDGARIRLIRMTDPYAPVAPGSTGTVGHVDDAGTLHMSWDDGRSLGLIPGVDQFEVMVP